ncbi:hypothetical protein NGM99_16540 [Mesorhizobium sp. RP14(2022)]|uniref:Nucleoside phosphorylase domain-containing protein n=1 Tax=Mesorhizobium liriopis TaxID=2953882 RepID=A0ABT1C979_9HYPH|nr:hypothetical protein [Mesorhizobium liriopis]MCO6051394.1 hypothetical protein [Mesorhizobium liriopis]
MANLDAKLYLENPVFLDFLNREANLAAGRAAPEQDDLAALEALLLTHSSRMSANISQMIEYSFGKKLLTPWLVKLIRENIILSTSHNSDISAFISERQKIYAHDSLRYPMYFDKIEIIEDFRITGRNSFSMTHRLRQNIFSFTDSQLPFGIGRVDEEDYKSFTDNIDFFQGAAVREPDAAITRALYEPHHRAIKTNAALVMASAARVISGLYMTNYAEMNACATCTGIFSSGYTDSLNSFPFFDIPILKALLRSLGYYRSMARRQAIQSLDIGHYGTPLHHKFCYLVRAFIDSCLSLTLTERLDSISKRDTWFSLRQSIEQIFQRHLQPESVAIKYPRDTINQFLELSSEALHRAAGKLRSEKPFANKWEQYVPNKNSMRFLILVATPTEEDEVHRSLIEAGFVEAQSVRMDKGVLATYTKAGGSEIFICRSSAGSSGTSGSHLLTEDAIRTTQPQYVISTGICFGFEDKKQAIGDVLIADSMQSYEKTRVGNRNRIVERGERIPSGSSLLSFALNRERQHRANRPSFKIHDGFILSGDKLVDDVRMVKQLRERFPDAIGGEMEGVGVMAASHRQGVEWILIKAVCDWGHSKNKDHQAIAAENAARFTIQLINDIVEARSSRPL